MRIDTAGVADPSFSLKLSFFLSVNLAVFFSCLNFKPTLTTALIRSTFLLYFLTLCDFKDGAFFCYCAYVLRISGYSGFLKEFVHCK